MPSSKQVISCYEKSFNELKREISSITPKTLASCEKLAKQLEKDCSSLEMFKSTLSASQLIKNKSDQIEKSRQFYLGEAKQMHTLRKDLSNISKKAEEQKSNFEWKNCSYSYRTQAKLGYFSKLKIQKNIRENKTLKKNAHDIGCEMVQKTTCHNNEDTVPI